MTDLSKNAATTTMYTDAFGPNVQNILVHGSRVVRSRIPAQVRRELNAAVKAGALGRFKKDGLKPEVFYNPNNKVSANEIREREATYAIRCIAGVIAIKPVEQRVAEALASLQDKAR